MSTLIPIIQWLEKTISPDRNVLLEAQLELEKSANQDLGQFISNMSIVLAEAENSSVARQAAGLQLKNCLTVRDSSLKKEYRKRWVSLPLKTRIAVRERLLSSLGTEIIYPSCAAQCLACISSAESLSQDDYLSSDNNSLSVMLTTLTHIFVTTDNERRKEAVMETIGFICQELPLKILDNHSSEILGPVVKCIEKQMLGKKIRLIASNALLNSLEFAHPHFEREGDRNLIMQVVCDATQSTVIEETVIALQILAKIATCYYQHLFNYMARAIIPITFKAIASDDTNVSLQGMEFWCSVAEIELDLASGVYDPACVLPVSHRYAEKALPTLVPLLVTVIANWQDESDDLDDLDDWTPVKGAVACLTLLSECCPDKIDLYVLPEVQPRIKDWDWKLRIAALWAVSSILEEIDPVKVDENLRPLMSSFWDLTHDHNSAKVRYAALMLTSRIFQTCPSLIPSSLGSLVKELIYHLKDDEPRVASVACDTLSSLVKIVYNQTVKETKEKNHSIATFPLTRYFGKIVTQLLKRTGERSDFLLRSAAHQALKNLLINSPDDCYDIVLNAFLVLLHQLKQLMTTNSTWNDHQVLVLLTISGGLVRLNANDSNTVQFRNEFMSCLMELLRSGMNHEDMFVAIATTISSLGPELKTHLALLISYLKSALESPDVCPMVVTLTADLFRVLGVESIPYLNDFCERVFKILAQNELDYKLRAECIFALNDMAISVELEHFRPYVAATMKELLKASSICAKNDSDYEEMQDNILKLYHTIFSFLSPEEYCQPQSVTKEGISFQFLMQECLTSLSKFIAAVVNNETSDMILTTSGALVGVIIIKMGAVESMKYLKSKLNFNWLLNTAANRTSLNGCKQICKAALFELQLEDSSKEKHR